MNQVITLFDRMDAWRHFPNYQLERRADIFFSLYLSEVLEAKLGLPIKAELTPEFPIRIGTIYPEIPIDKSYKIDYLALSGDAETAVLIGLKTESFSRREGQDKSILKHRKKWALPASWVGFWIYSELQHRSESISLFSCIWKQ